MTAVAHPASISIGPGESSPVPTAAEEVAPCVAAESYDCIAALPATRRLSSSRDAGWSSLLVERSRSTGPCPAYETLPTRDQTIVVVTSGEVEVAARAGGFWRRTRYAAGTVGRTRAGQSDRLAWRLARPDASFEKIHLFVPERVFEEAAEHLRRPGLPSSTHADFTLAVPDPLVVQAATSLVAAADTGAPDLYAQATAHMLAVHLLTRHGRFGGTDDDRGIGSLPDRRIARVVDYMAAHLDRPLSLDRLAAEAGISKFHFARLFREATGSSPARLLVRLRLEAARRLLHGSDTGIGEVAARCGYANAAHFSVAYRRQFGTSPREARRAAAVQGVAHDRGDR